MSYLKVKDPQLIKDYLVRKKLVRDRFLSERTGDIELQQDLSKFFRPITRSQRETQEEAAKKITESQLETARRITEGLVPISEGIRQLPGSIVQQFPRITFTKETSEEEKKDIPIKLEEEAIKLKSNEIIFDKIQEYKYKNEFEETFGLTEDEKNNYWLGNSFFQLSGDENNTYIVVGKKHYNYSDGLMELIFSKNPKNSNETDLANYQEIMQVSGAIYHKNDPKSVHPKGNYRGKKWELLKPVWDEIKKNRLPKPLKQKRPSTIRKIIVSPEKSKKILSAKPPDFPSSESEDSEPKGSEPKGSKEKGFSASGLRKKKTTIVIPSDPNALLERFDLLMASKDAGNTGVKNELVSFCDELKRQRVLNTKSYKKLMSIL